MKDENNKKRVMHIDTSHKLHERNDTGIAYRIIKTKEHKGAAISLKLKKELERKLDAHLDRARIYAIVIYFLIKDNLDIFDELIICGDEDYHRVKKYVSLLFQDNKEFVNKTIKSISELRIETGSKNLRSYADDVAYSYMRRALKSTARRQKGTPLNVIRITYNMFYKKWKEIQEKIIKGGE